MKLVVDVDLAWRRAIGRLTGQPAGVRPGSIFYEVWVPRRTSVLCFDDEAVRFHPFEWMDLAGAPQPRWDKGAGGPLQLLFAGKPVGAFEETSRIVLRMYAYMPKDVFFPGVLVPTQLGSCVLERGHAYKVPVFCRADSPWMDMGPGPGVQVYAHAWLDCAADPLPPPHQYYAIDFDEDFDGFYQVLTRITYPALEWAVQRRERGDSPPSMKTFVSIPPFYPVAGTCLYPPEYLAANIPDDENRHNFRAFFGCSAAMAWRVDRGMGVPACDPAWLRERLKESRSLRGAKRVELLFAEFSGSEDYYGGLEGLEPWEKEFMCIVRFGVEAHVEPGGHNKGRDVLHHWVLEVLEDSLRALSCFATRGYVYDRRWYLERGVLKCNMRTDEFTLSFTIQGDCEDSNSTVYYLFLEVLKLKTAEGKLMHAFKTCLAAAGVPICVMGSAHMPSGSVREEGRTPHCFGFCIPAHTFARILWGPGSMSAEAASEELKQVLGVTVCPEMLKRTPPMIFETIFLASSYLNRSIHLRDGYAERFAVFNKHMVCKGEDPVYPGAVGAEYLMTLPDETGVAHGFITHTRVHTAMTGALRFFFTQATRTRCRGEVLACSLRPPALVEPCTQDLGDAAHVFAFVSASAAGGPIDRYSVPVSDIHSRAPPFRLAVRPFDPSMRDLELELLRNERPLVPLPPLLNQGLAAAFAELMNARLKHGVTIVLGEPAEQEKDRFSLFVRADRLARGAELAAELCAQLNPRSLSLRPFAYALVVILNF